MIEVNIIFLVLWKSSKPIVYGNMLPIFYHTNPIKLFTAVIYDFHYKLVFVPGKPFQPSLMFVGKATGAYARKACHRETLLLIKKIRKLLQQKAL